VDEYTRAFRALAEADVRFILVGVAGVNLYAGVRGAIFATEDRDLLLPHDGENLLRCWRTLKASGWNLWSLDEPLPEPLDPDLAERALARKATVSATHPDGLTLDLTLEIAGFHFEEVWSARRIFRSEGTEIPVALLRHILESKRAAGRPKDLLFFTTHEQMLHDLLREEESR
jgi:hypothetical protein